ncbi:MAG: hypothetical protein ACRD12_01680 [Acidimicrobiales bacterium]
MELTPLRPRLLASGGLNVAASTAGFAVGLALIDARATDIGLFVLTAGAAGGVSALLWRRRLRRVVTPPPDGAVVVPPRLRPWDALAPFVAAALILAMVGFEIVRPWVFGSGVGAGLADVWAATRVDGRVFRRVGWPKRGEPSLYAGAGSLR